MRDERGRDRRHDDGRYGHRRDARHGREEDRYVRESAYAIRREGIYDDVERRRDVPYDAWERRREGYYDSRDHEREQSHVPNERERLHVPNVLKIEDNGSFTTVFLTEIPEGLTPDECVDALDRCGYSGTYDFFLFEVGKYVAAKFITFLIG